MKKPGWCWIDDHLKPKICPLYTLLSRIYETLVIWSKSKVNSTGHIPRAVVLQRSLPNICIDKESVILRSTHTCKHQVMLRFSVVLWYRSSEFQSDKYLQKAKDLTKSLDCVSSLHLIDAYLVGFLHFSHNLRYSI